MCVMIFLPILKFLMRIIRMSSRRARCEEIFNNFASNFSMVNFYYFCEIIYLIKIFHFKLLIKNVKDFKFYRLKSFSETICNKRISVWKLHSMNDFPFSPDVLVSVCKFTEIEREKRNLHQRRTAEIRQKLRRWKTRFSRVREFSSFPTVSRPFFRMPCRESSIVHSQLQRHKLLFAKKKI